MIKMKKRWEGRVRFDVDFGSYVIDERGNIEIVIDKDFKDDVVFYVLVPLKKHLRMKKFDGEDVDVWEFVVENV